MRCKPEPGQKKERRAGAAMGRKITGDGAFRQGRPDARALPAARRRTGPAAHSPPGRWSMALAPGTGKSLTAGLALAFLGSIAFSGKAIIVKLAYRHGVDAVTLIMYRMLF